MLRIPPGVAHQAEALEDTFELDVFSPVRDDGSIDMVAGGAML